MLELSKLQWFLYLSYFWQAHNISGWLWTTGFFTKKCTKTVAVSSKFKTAKHHESLSSFIKLLLNFWNRLSWFLRNHHQKLSYIHILIHTYFFSNFGDAEWFETWRKRIFWQKYISFRNSININITNRELIALSKYISQMHKSREV